MRKLLVLLVVLCATEGFSQDLSTESVGIINDVAMADKSSVSYEVSETELFDVRSPELMTSNYQEENAPNGSFKPYWTSGVLFGFAPWTSEGNIGGNDKDGLSIICDFCGVRYFSEKAFYRIGIGYKGSNFGNATDVYVINKYKKYDKKRITSRLTVNDIYVPFEFGTCLNKCTSKFNMFITGGAYGALAVSATQENKDINYNKTELKMKDIDGFEQLAFGLRANAFVTISGFAIGGFAMFGLSGHDKNINYYGITLGYGFGYE